MRLLFSALCWGSPRPERSRSQSSSVLLCPCPAFLPCRSTCSGSHGSREREGGMQICKQISRAIRDVGGGRLTSHAAFPILFWNTYDWLNRAPQANSFDKASLLLTRWLGEHQEISLNSQLLFLSCKRKLSRAMLWVRSAPRTCTTPDSSELFLVCLLDLTHQHHNSERGNRTMEIPKTAAGKFHCPALYHSMHPWHT